MTPEQKLKWAILAQTAKWDKKPEPEYPCENVDELYKKLVEEDAHWDGMNEVRCSGIDTKLPCENSRHYESESVAMQMPDGKWVGWTYWHGGGKHGEPELIDWMEHAYDVECMEEEKMVIIHHFTRK